MVQLLFPGVYVGDLSGLVEGGASAPHQLQQGQGLPQLKHIQYISRGA